MPYFNTQENFLPAIFSATDCEGPNMSNNYTGLRRFKRDDAAAADRCIERLLKMRQTLNAIRKRKSDGSLLLATWNIRDFDSNKFKFGPRLPETFYYIAEMISCFDLVAVQEVNRDLTALETVMRILGREWDYIATDTTEGPGGNEERMAFVFNTEKVWFRKIAGEVVLPEGQLVVSPKKVKVPKDQNKGEQPEVTTEEAKQQFARTPFLVAFQSGWFRFSLCTVHITTGRTPANSSSGASPRSRPSWNSLLNAKTRPASRRRIVLAMSKTIYFSETLTSSVPSTRRCKR